MPLPRGHQETCRVECCIGSDERRAALEREFDQQGIPLPLTSKMAWVATVSSAVGWLVGVRDGEGRLRGGCGATVYRSRALPGHRIIRAERFGNGLGRGTIAQAAINGLVEAARGCIGVLWLRVEVLVPDPAHRSDLGSLLREAGFARLARPRNYTRTIGVDLRVSPDQLLGTLGSRARRAIRKADGLPIRAELIRDPRLASRMQQIREETYRRTGGTPGAFDAGAAIAFASAHPDLVRLVGLFHNEEQGDSALLAFAWAHFHGDHASYETAASTRGVDPKVPLMYPLLFDLMKWAQTLGASWFDLGGISDGAPDGGEDPLGGISDFKRGFSDSVVQVGEDWEMILAPRRAVVAGWVGRAVRGLHR